MSGGPHAAGDPAVRREESRHGPCDGGDALVLENERLIARMNQFFDRVESQLRGPAPGSGGPGLGGPTVESQAKASVLSSFLLGRLHRYCRSGFKRAPTEHLEASLQALLHG